MSKPLETLTPQELHERIIQLESRLAFIEKRQIRSLKEQIGDLQHAVGFISHDMLWPIIDKVLPSNLKTQEQIAAILGNETKSAH
jgi:uncharacterized coiled-coil protein SlyX